MWFNDKFNKDGTIHFDVNEWICTDHDERQFCRIINEHEFEYIQLKDIAMDVSDDFCRILETLNDKTKLCDWYQCEIDVNDYDEEEIKDYVAPYGEILDGVDDVQDRNQLIAECIFETDLIMGEYE